MKEFMFIIWIEGLSYKRGEKIKTLTDSDHTYTTKMTESLRIKESDIGVVKTFLNRKGITNNSITFVRTNYCPNGCMFNTNNYYK